MDRVQHAQPTPRGRRLLLRLGLLAFCAGLLLLLSSRPADAAERREPLLDPVGTTLKATAREVDSFAGRAAGSGSSTVGGTADAARQAVAPPRRPAPGAARRLVASTVRRGAPAVTSPVRRVAPPTRAITAPARSAARSAATASKPATRTLTATLDRAAEVVGRAGGSGRRGCQPGHRAGPVRPVSTRWRWLRWVGLAPSPVVRLLRWFPVGCRCRGWLVRGLGRGSVPRPGTLAPRSQVSRAPGRRQASHPLPRRIRSVWPPTAPARPPPGRSGPGRP